MPDPEKKKAKPKQKDCDCEKYSPAGAMEPMPGLPRAELPSGDQVLGGGDWYDPEDPAFKMHRARLGPDGQLRAGGAEPMPGIPSRELPDGTLTVGGGDGSWWDPTAPQFGGPPAEQSFLDQLIQALGMAQQGKGR